MQAVSLIAPGCPGFLLVPERCHRINPASSPCRNPAGQRRDTQQNRRYTDENRNVDRAVRNGVKGDDHREQPSNRRAPGDGTQVLSNDLEDDPIAGGAER